jgi:hypothetical protein
VYRHCRHPCAFLLLAATLVLFAAHALADATRIELIELKGRTAEELIPLLQPLVKPGGALSGTGYRLIVRATPAQHREIRRLLEELDHAPQRLLISVHMGELALGERQGAAVGMERRLGDVGVNAGAPAPERQPGLTVTEQDAHGSTRLRAYAERHLTDRGEGQQVQALEGEPAYIASGSDFPYPTRLGVWRGPRGGGGAVEMQYRETRSGFFAVARLRGDQVTVRISPRREALLPQGGGVVQSQQIVTTVSGPLGHWIRLGASGGGSEVRDSTTGRSVTSRTLHSQPMWLKVERLP